MTVTLLRHKIILHSECLSDLSGFRTSRCQPDSSESGFQTVSKIRTDNMSEIRDSQHENAPKEQNPDFECSDLSEIQTTTYLDFGKVWLSSVPISDIHCKLLKVESDEKYFYAFFGMIIDFFWTAFFRQDFYCYTLGI